MNINTDQIVSISEANRNFSKVARMAESMGEIIIFKNNKPKYKLIDLEHEHELEASGPSEDELIDAAAERILKKYKKAFEELAK
ncbi:MAG: type II toxin-antitoxin system prevent-host-death family antitoxin [Clostridia bacterium]|nr:type II toxin-antitoxin system prevent-host-death family antitoxin [Clostridia bacterium]